VDKKPQTNVGPVLCKKNQSPLNPLEISRISISTPANFRLAPPLLKPHAPMCSWPDEYSINKPLK